MITTFFWCKFGFGKCSGASSWFYHWVSHHWLSHKIHFSLHITVWLRNGSLLHRIREDDSSKQWFFKILISSWSTHLLSFFHLSNLLQMLKIVEWLMLSSLATSHVVVKGWALMMALRWLLSLLMASHCTPHLQGTFLQNFLNHHCPVCSLAVPGLNGLLMLRVVSPALQPILNSKLLGFAFCLISFP